MRALMQVAVIALLASFAARNSDYLKNNVVIASIDSVAYYKNRIMGGWAVSKLESNNNVEEFKNCPHIYFSPAKAASIVWPKHKPDNMKWKLSGKVLYLKYTHAHYPDNFFAEDSVYAFSFVNKGRSAELRLKQVHTNITYILTR